MIEFIMYLNCPRCYSFNIVLTTSEWVCNTCGYNWTQEKEQRQKYLS